MADVDLFDNPTDDQLAAAFVGKTDAGLVAAWERAYQWRDWDECELVYAEQMRRADPGARVPAGAGSGGGR